MNRLRVFISSTMNDLVNEREGVARLLRAFNFEPVRAEELSPDGTDSWERIASAIAACDVVVLILGESYGWCPDAGLRHETRMSVTELEFREAKRLGIPILPFVKKLPYSPGPPTPDQQQRDRFRGDVEAWDGGRFRAQFENAWDLSEAVGRAVVSLLTDRFRTLAVQQRRDSLAAEAVPTPGQVPRRIDLPSNLVSAVASGHVTLLLGAGASLAAGLPAVPAFTESLVEGLRSKLADYSPPQSGTTFNAVATDYETVFGIDGLREAIRVLLDSELYRPLRMHETMSRSFDVIVTTNYDLLLDRADPSRTVVTTLDRERRLPRRVLVKLHGSVDAPGTMVATEDDVARFETTHAGLLDLVVRRLRAEPTLVVGSSLRDPSIVRMLDTAGPDFSGWIVAPSFTLTDHQRLSRRNLLPIAASAESFFDSLALALARRASPSSDGAPA